MSAEKGVADAAQMRWLIVKELLEANKYPTAKALVSVAKEIEDYVVGGTTKNVELDGNLSVVLSQEFWRSILTEAGVEPLNQVAFFNALQDRGWRIE